MKKIAQGLPEHDVSKVRASFCRGLLQEQRQFFFRSRKTRKFPTFHAPGKRH
jgi:hypothetical protein